jgi:glycosyltransferase involved in cell wall biosynthesis
MNILFVFYVPSGGVETLNRQRCSALKMININCHFLYYRKQRELINNHDAPTFITDDDNEIKKIIDEGNYTAIIIISDYRAIKRFRDLGYTGKIILEIQGYGPKHGVLNPKTPHIVEIFNEFYPSFPKFAFNNCFDTSQFSYQSHPVSNQPIIAWTGRIEDNKNWREFLHIGHQLINHYHPNLQLYMFEDPTLSTAKEREDFHQLIQGLNLGNNLTIHSNIPHKKMADYFSIIGDSGGFLCSTSKVEGAPYAILEAMSCKCPILTTDSDGVRSSIIHNQTGKYYTIGNIEEAVREANELMTNQYLREYIRATALTHVKQEFSPELYSRHFAEMLTSLGIVLKK